MAQVRAFHIYQWHMQAAKMVKVKCVRFSSLVWCVSPPMSAYYDYLSLFSHFTILAACICH